MTAYRSTTAGLSRGVHSLLKLQAQQHERRILRTTALLLKYPLAHSMGTSDMSTGYRVMHLC